MTAKRSRSPLNRILFWLLVLILVFWILFPFYWAVVSSLKPGDELFSTPVTYWPRHLDFSTYQRVFHNALFTHALLNSAIVATSSVIIALAFGALSAYALGRLHFRGKNVLLYVILAMTMFPQVAILGSLFTMVRAFGIFNTPLALILTYQTFTLPFTVWVLSNYFEGLPAELEQAALVDGATPIQAFWMILLPLAAPGLVTTGMLAFIAAWNEFLYALTFTINNQARTVPVAIAFFSGSTPYEIPWGDIMAASVTVTVPLVLLVLIFQRRIVQGLTAGAVKG